MILVARARDPIDAIPTFVGDDPACADRVRADPVRTAAELALAALTVAALTASGCAAGDSGAGGWAGTRDTIGGIEVVRNPAEPLLADGAVRAVALWTAAGGESDSADAPIWERPASVRVADGVVYVLDALAARVYAHRAEDGAALAVIGRKGPGPGEVDRPTGFALPAGRIVIGDGSGALEVFDRAGAHLRSIRPNGIVFGVHALGADRLLLSRFQGQDMGWTVLGPSDESRTLDTPEWLADMPEAVDACARHATSGATILRAHCALLRFQRIADTGAVLTEILVDRPPEPSTEAELDAYERRIRDLMAADGLPPALVDRTASAQRETLRIRRLFRGIRHDAVTGRFWIREQAPEDFGGGPPTLHLFAADGVYLARVAFERAWTDFDVDDGRIYALERDPATDLARLVAYRIEVPEGLSPAGTTARMTKEEDR